MTEYLPRSAWTSSRASGSTLSGTLLRGVAVHWPGTTQDAIGKASQAEIAERLRHYRSYHLGKGWQDIGYNVAIDQAGRVWMLRSTDWHGNMVGAHCASQANPDANREYVGVLLLLGDREPLSSAMIHAFRSWYHNRFLPVWRNRFDVRGHGQVPGASTSCPGPYARALMGDLTDPNPSQEDDEMELTDRIPLLSAGTVKWSTADTTVQGAFTSALYYILETRNLAASNKAQLAALTSAVAALSSDPDLDEERITAIVRDAVLEAVPDVTADAIVEELAERLAQGA
jgi:hypothetical protein